MCSGCHLCELWCAVKNSGASNVHRARLRVVEMATGVHVPLTCQQCQDPACQAACPSSAFLYDEALKIVTIIDEKCNGCQECVGACPFGMISIDPTTHHAIKCELCHGDDPACVSNCPSKVLGALDNLQVAEYNRRRFAATLAAEDEMLRRRSGGEEPVIKHLEMG
jgi:anaerobic carbon-monoxide dehydrogenase iron sulfur subunit